MLKKDGGCRFRILLMYAVLFVILFSMIVSASRLPTVRGDDNNWGTVLNDYLNISHNESGELRSDIVSTAQITNGTITDADISDTTNLTLGEKITFTLGEIIDNIVDGWIRVVGGLNITENLEISGSVIINKNVTINSSDFHVDVANDRVGIGTVNPNATLQVAGEIFLQNDSDKLFFGQAKDVSINYNGSQTQFTNEVGSGDWIFGSGRVGFGTTGPGMELEIVRGDGSSPTIHEETLLRLRNNLNSGDDVQLSLVSATNAETAIFFGDTENNDQGRVDYDNSADSLSFHTNDSGTGHFTIQGDGVLTTYSNWLSGDEDKEGINIMSSGFVGIGTDNAMNLLHVEGTSPFIEIESSASQKDAGIVFTNVDTNKWKLFKGYTNDHNLFLNNSSSNVMTWEQGGNVGIGTNSPNATLTADGIIQTLPRSSATCDSTSEGGIFYDSDDNHFYGCNSTDWVQLDN